jgi:HEAT repeat protein
MRAASVLLAGVTAALVGPAVVRAEAVHNGYPVSALRGYLHSPQPGHAAMALEALTALGVAAAPAVPDLIALCKSPSARPWAEKALDSIGGPAVTPLARALESPDDELRASAARVLAGFREPGRIGTGALRRALKDAAPAVRHQAAVGLCRRGDRSPDTVAQVVAALRGPNSALRDEALKAVALLGKDGKAAVPDLVALLDDYNGSALAALALGKVGPDARPAVPALVKQLRITDPENSPGFHQHRRLAAALALVDLRAELDVALPVLIAEGLEFRAVDRSFRLHPQYAPLAGPALARLGERALPALAAAVLEHPRAEVRAGAARALSLFARVDAKAVVALRAAQKDLPDVARWAAAALVEAGDPGADLALLVEGVHVYPGRVTIGHGSTNHFDWNTVASAALYRGGARSVPALARGLTSSSAHVRAGSAEMLGRLGQAANYRQPLTKLLHDKDNDVRLWAAIALANDPASAKTVVPSLLEDVRERFLPRAEKEFGPRAPPRVHPLVDRFAEGWGLVEDHGPRPSESDEPRQAARHHHQEASLAALVKLGQQAWPQLLEALDSPYAPRVAAGAVVLIQGIRDRKNEDLFKQVLGVLESDKARLRQRACVILSEVGPSAKRAVPVLTTLLRDADRRVRVQAAVALWRIRREADALLPVLTEALKSEDMVARRVAARQLGAMSFAGRPALPALVNQLNPLGNFANGEVRRAIYRLAPDAREPLAAALRHPTPRVRDAATDALVVYGPAGTPVLAAALEADQVETRRAAVEAFQRMGVIDRAAASALRPRLKDPDPAVRYGAAVALARLQDSPVEVAPVLAAALNEGDRNLRRRVAAGLGELARQSGVAFEPLAKALRDGDAEVRSLAATGLGRVKGRGKEAVPLLLGALKDGAPQVRAAALLGLRDLLPQVADVGKVVSALLELRMEENAEVRLEMVTALKALAPRATETKGLTAGLLEIARTDPGYRVKQEAWRALGKVKGDPAAVVAAMLEVLDQAGEDEEGPELAMGALRGLGARGLVHVLAGLKSRAVRTRRFVVAFLGEVEPKAPREAVPALVGALADEDDQVRREAVRALVRLQASGKEVAAGLAGRLRHDQDAVVRAEAASALGGLKEGARTALPDLLAATADAHGQTRINSIRALGRFPEDARQIRPVVEPILKDKQAHFSRAALETLYALDRGPKASPLLVTQLKANPHAEVRSTAAYLLGEVKDTDPAVVAALTAALKDPGPGVRGNALYALGHLGKAALPALEKLTAALKDDQAHHRFRAASALGQIGPGAKAAVPALRLLLRDPSEEVRHAAAEALKSIER